MVFTAEVYEDDEDGAKFVVEVVYALLFEGALGRVALEVKLEIEAKLEL